MGIKRAVSLTTSYNMHLVLGAHETPWEGTVCFWM